MEENKNATVLLNKGINFLTGNCTGGKLVQGANSLLCSMILYILMTWAFVGDNSLWARFKRLEDNYTTLASSITNNAQHDTDRDISTDNGLTSLRGRMANAEGNIQSLNTRVTVLDATTCKIGRHCQ